MRIKILDGLHLLLQQVDREDPPGEYPRVDKITLPDPQDNPFGL